MTLDELWQATLAELEINISRANFKTWFRETRIHDHSDDVVIISCPNTFTKSWLENKYHKNIQASLRRITDVPVLQVVYQVISAAQAQKELENLAKTVDAVKEKQDDSTKLHTPAQPVARVREDGLAPKHTFDSYVTGKANELARAACFAVAERPGDVYNPLFLYGGVGLGKTHLMHAAGNEIIKRSKNDSTKILYVTCEKFTDDFIKAVKSGRADAFKRKYRNIDALLIDDIQFLAGKEGTQEEFFHTFNTLHQTNRQIIITSDRPPKAIPSLEERLISRFEWGMIADVGQPDVETRTAILQQKAQEKGHKVDPKILSLIAESIQSNVRELEGALNKIVAHHQLTNTTPTIESTREILQSISKQPKRGGVTPKQVLITICKHFDIASEDLIGSSRKKELVVPRQIAMFLMREELNHSFPNIGEELGGRDHTTIMHGYVKVREAVKEDDRLNNDITIIKERLYGNGE